MRRLTLLGLTLAAVFATAAALSTSAFARELPENLPTSSTARTWTGESEGKTEFKASSAEKTEFVVICESITSEGTEEANKPLGLFHMHCFGAHAIVAGSTVKCTDLNHATAGEILFLGTWHLAFDRENGKEFKELTTGILLLVELVHFSCSALVLIEVKGEQLCLHLKATEESTKHSFHCIATNQFEQTEEWCKKDVAGKCEEAVKPKLECSLNHAAFGPCAMFGLASMTYKVKIFADI